VDSIELARSRDEHPLVGEVVGGKYTIAGLLHRGQRNELFVAHEETDESVHTLVLKIPLEMTEESQAPIAREAAFLGAVEHPNVVMMRDFGTAHVPSSFLVLEPVPGETLADTIQRAGPLDERRVLEVFWQILAGVSALHAHGIVHRDLRPRNVCLEPREGLPPLVKLIDFSSAKFVRLDHPDELHEPPYFVGAHRYMAPEQHRGESAGPWVDVYSIGMMIHAAMVGELPTPGSKLSDSRPVSRSLDEVVARALAPDPLDRFPNASEFQDALTRALLVR
jgi:serine/threonine-protein kinase